MDLKDNASSIATVQIAMSSITTEDSDDRVTFADLDDRASFLSLMQCLKRNTTHNFLVDFSDETARAAVDLTSGSIAALLQVERPDILGTRWLNIWHPYAQRDTLQQIARHYDFTPRLMALICSDPHYLPPTRSKSSTDRLSNGSFWRRNHVRVEDCEAGKDSDELSEHCSIASTGSIAGGNIYRIAENLWHYSSVDFGRSYVCLGYNSLYGTRNSGAGPGHGLLPHCVRVWTWLILCEDGTVISINEDPFAHVLGPLNTLQQKVLDETRRNLVNVFASLSTVGDDNLLTQNPLTLLPLRTRLGDTIEESAHRESDAPGLLFFYLFENWHNSYTLITRKESRYGVELERLREEMFRKPELQHIDLLDRLGKELGVLRRHYASYEKIIDRLIEPQIQTAASLQNSRVVGGDSSQASLRTVQLVTENKSMLGVSLSSAARARFKRLRDVIDLYALCEVEEYIKQKDALVAMNFNLIAIKQSTDVERLTRITLLITKFTLLFFPISLMTAYFSVELTNVSYTVTQYWVSFAVIFSFSMVAMVLFGLFSKSVETMVVIRAGSKLVRRAWADFRT